LGPSTTAAPPAITDTLSPSITPSITSTATIEPYDKAQFIKDVTIPDNTKLAPGESFTKTWRLKNIGNTTWTSSYSLAFDSGDSMSAPASKQLTPGSVAPGETVDVSVNLVAPNPTGEYKGNWKLRNASNVIFGSIYVQIVVGTGNDTVYNFMNDYCDAKWRNATSNLPCPGTDVDNKGFVLIKNNPSLDDGTAVIGKALETHPQWIDDGMIKGTFPAIKIYPGDRFKAKLSCMQGGAACKVQYQLNYHIEGGPDVQNLASWSRTYGQGPHSADVDLSALAGKEVQFILTVKANGSSGQDWALWLSPRIVR
jgi:hypothetical protein